MRNRTLGIACAAGGLAIVAPLSLITAQQSQPSEGPFRTPPPRQPEQQPKQPDRPPGQVFTVPETSDYLTQADVNRLIAEWPQKNKDAVKTLITKYGPPRDGCRSLLIWLNTGPFHKTIVINDEIEHNFPITHSDFLEQFLYFKVPADKFDELAQFEGSVYADRTAGTLSARCDKEENNYLILNLAHEVITGKKTPQDARKAAADFARQAASGQKPEIMTKLMFQPQTRAAADPDKPAQERAGADEVKPPAPTPSGG